MLSCQSAHWAETWGCRRVGEKPKHRIMTCLFLAQNVTNICKKKKKEEKWIDSSKRLSLHSKTYIQQEHGWSTVLTHDLTAEIPSRPSLDMFFTTWCSKKMTFVSVWFSVCTLKVPLQHLHLWELCIFLKIPDCFNTQISYWNWGLMFCDRNDSCQRRKNRSIRKTLSVNAASVSLTILQCDHDANNQEHFCHPVVNHQ